MKTPENNETTQPDEQATPIPESTVEASLTTKGKPASKKEKTPKAPKAPKATKAAKTPKSKGENSDAGKEASDDQSGAETPALSKYRFKFLLFFNNNSNQSKFVEAEAETIGDAYLIAQGNIEKIPNVKRYEYLQKSTVKL